MLGPERPWSFRVVVVVGRVRRTVVSGDGDGLDNGWVVVWDGIAVVEAEGAAVLAVVNSGRPPGDRPASPEADW